MTLQKTLNWENLIYYARSERSEGSAQLLAFKRENFVYSRTKNSHFSMCPFRGCGFTYGKKTSLLHVSIFSHFEIVEIISPNTWEITSSASFAWTTDNFQALLKGIFSWVCFLPFAGKHRSRTVRNPFYIHWVWIMRLAGLITLWIINFHALLMITFQAHFISSLYLFFSLATFCC